MHDRKLNRKPNYDYGLPGGYYVTICVKNHSHVFGKISNDTMVLNKWGTIVENQWKWLFTQYSHILLDEYVVMPNHFHAIIFLVGTDRDRSLPCGKPLPGLIAAFKMTASKIIHQSGMPGFEWQKSYYDHIIRGQSQLTRIRKYIRNNPIKWKLDMKLLEQIHQGQLDFEQGRYRIVR